MGERASSLQLRRLTTYTAAADAAAAIAPCGCVLPVLWMLLLPLLLPSEMPEATAVFTRKVFVVAHRLCAARLLLKQRLSGRPPFGDVCLHPSSLHAPPGSDRTCCCPRQLLLDAVDNAAIRNAFLGTCFAFEECVSTCFTSRPFTEEGDQK